MAEPIIYGSRGQQWHADFVAYMHFIANHASYSDMPDAFVQPVFDAACKVAPAEHWIWDGVHPTYSGHQLMADEWERTDRAKWPSR